MIKQLQSRVIAHNQSGYALVTSMLLLLVLATMGISMYGNVTVQEQMAFNMRVKNRTFITADSILQNNWTLEKLRAQMVATNAAAVEINSVYDQGSTITIKGKVNVCYVGENNDSPGNSLDSSLNENNIVYKLQTFQAEGTATEGATHATTTLAQGGYIILPSAGKAGNCDADGDGVPDQDEDDACKNTPPGSIVDEKGCAVT